MTRKCIIAKIRGRKNVNEAKKRKLVENREEFKISCGNRGIYKFCGYRGDLHYLRKEWTPLCTASLKTELPRRFNIKNSKSC